VNVSRLIEEAKSTNTALELNSYPDRLDLSVPYVREAMNAGVRITIDTDAHDETALSFIKVRRGPSEEGVGGEGEHNKLPTLGGVRRVFEEQQTAISFKGDRPVAVARERISRIDALRELSLHRRRRRSL
jgi:hypothetical protein